MVNENMVGASRGMGHRTSASRRGRRSGCRSPPAAAAAAGSRSRTSTRSTRSATPTCSSSARSPGASASRSTTRASSTRPASATPSSRLINSVQDALAGELELQAIYDVVGDKIQEVFDAQVVDIGVLDETDGLIHFPYVIERGVRANDPPLPVVGFRKILLEQQEPLLIEAMTDEIREQHGFQVSSGDMARSAIWVPLVVAGKGRGWISLQNVDRDHAFGESDVQLLGTLAGSLGVALENARLVHETRQRVAELAVINSVQDSIAGELDQQAIYDVVGEKLRQVFDAQVVDIAVHDEDAGLMRFVYQIERGVQFPNVTFPVMGFRKHVMETREPLAIHEDMDAALVRYGNPAAVAGEPSNGSAIFQPLVVGGRATGVDLDPEPRPRARLQPVGPAAALDDRRQPRRRARERAADPRDEAARRRARRR